MMAKTMAHVGVTEVVDTCSEAQNFVCERGAVPLGVITQVGVTTIPSTLAIGGSA